MGIIQPITDRNVLEKMKEYLRERNLRDYLLFRVGLNLGLSVQELLHLKIEDILDQDIYISRNCQIQIIPAIKYEIKRYIKGREKGFLFTSSKGNPVSRLHLYLVLQRAARAANYKNPIGGITLRKTFAYWAYQEKRALLSSLSNYLGHQTTKHTLKYIGLDESTVFEENLIFMNL